MPTRMREAGPCAGAGENRSADMVGDSRGMTDHATGKVKGSTLPLSSRVLRSSVQGQVIGIRATRRHERRGRQAGKVAKLVHEMRLVAVSAVAGHGAPVDPGRAIDRI